LARRPCPTRAASWYYDAISSDSGASSSLLFAIASRTNANELLEVDRLDEDGDDAMSGAVGQRARSAEHRGDVAMQESLLSRSFKHREPVAIGQVVVGHDRLCCRRASAIARRATW
jgi:hypothetical protein